MISAVIAFFGTPVGKVALSAIGGAAAAAGGWLVHRVLHLQKKVAELEQRLTVIEEQ